MSPSQLIGTILKKYLHEKLIVVCSVVLECVIILVINTVKHLVFSICHLFSLFLYFVQVSDSGLSWSTPFGGGIDLLVIGFHVVVFVLILCLCVSILCVNVVSII